MAEFIIFLITLTILTLFNPYLLGDPDTYIKGEVIQSPQFSGLIVKKWFNIKGKGFHFRKARITPFFLFSFNNDTVYVTTLTGDTHIESFNKVFCHSRQHILWNSGDYVRNYLHQSFQGPRLEKSHISSNPGSKGAIEYPLERRSGDRETYRVKFLRERRSVCPEVPFC